MDRLERAVRELDSLVGAPSLGVRPDEQEPNKAESGVAEACEEAVEEQPGHQIAPDSRDRDDLGNPARGGHHAEEGRKPRIEERPVGRFEPRQAAPDDAPTDLANEEGSGAQANGRILARARPLASDRDQRSEQRGERSREEKADPQSVRRAPAAGAATEHDRNAGEAGQTNGDLRDQGKRFDGNLRNAALRTSGSAARTPATEERLRVALDKPRSEERKVP